MTRLLQYVGVIFFAMMYVDASAQSSVFNKARWLAGKWENQTSRGKMIEEWTVQNDSMFNAKSYRITEADTVLLESVVLKKDGNEVFYIPTVKGQNNEQPVRFRLTSITDSSMTFENPAHDFPQKITYTRIDAQSLMAEISGRVNAEMRTRKFPMKRVQR